MLSGLAVSPLPMLVQYSGLLDGPPGCDPAFCAVWFRFCMLRGYLVYRPSEVPTVYRLLDSVAKGCPGHGPMHWLVESAGERKRLGLPVPSNLAGPIQHFRAAILDAWRVLLWHGWHFRAAILDAWRVLLWHGWLPLLSRVAGGSPWVENPAEGAANLLECALGA